MVGRVKESAGELTLAAAVWSELESCDCVVVDATEVGLSEGCVPFELLPTGGKSFGPPGEPPGSPGGFGKSPSGLISAGPSDLPSRTSWATLATSSSVTCDLTKYLLAPSLLALSLSSAWLSAVIITTLVSLVSGVLRKISSISKPLILGIMMSAIIRSGFSFTARAKASSPSAAEIIS